MKGERSIPSRSADTVIIEHDGIVEKTSVTARAELSWYRKCERFRYCRIPHVLGLVAESGGEVATIGMKFVENAPLHSIDPHELAEGIIEAIDELRKIPLIIAPPPVETIADRVDHLASFRKDLFRSDVIGLALNTLTNEPVRSELTLASSFAHGDLTVDNVLWSHESGVILVDPRYDVAEYSSYLYDVATFVTSVEGGVRAGRWNADDSASLVTVSEILKEKFYGPALHSLVVCRLVSDAFYDEKNAWNIVQLIEEYAR